MIGKLYRALIKILPKQRIPKLPRGMLASEYNGMTLDERRVLARLGARDPKGIKLAMQRAGVGTVQELIDQLEHQQPRRDFERRLNRLICAMQNALPYDPHQREILMDARAAKRAQKPENVEISRRLKTVLERMKD
jgi:hypothetical protein